MHKARKSMQQVCPVCGVGKYVRCVQATKKVPGKQDSESLMKLVTGYDSKADWERAEQDKEAMQEHDAQLAWAEFQVLSAVRSLKELNPNHALVVLVEGFLDNAQELLDSGQLELHLEEVKPN